jgi:uncharacterized membrane protein (DUF2068 family)
MSESAVAAPSAPGVAEEPEPHESAGESRLITIIGIFKASKGAIPLLTALGTFRLIGKDLDDEVDVISAIFHLAPDGRLIQWLYLRVDDITDGTLKTVVGVGAVYGTLLCTEGYGLIRRRKWAEVLVIIATLIPVPVEIYELVEGPKLIKVLVLALNLAIVGYLFRRRQQFLTREQVREARAVKHEGRLAASVPTSAGPPSP